MSSFEDSFSTWLKSQKSSLDLACGDAVRAGLAGLNVAEFTAANKSLNNLYADTSSGVAIPGGDCDYSLKGIGQLYTAHWHGKRMHDALSVLVPLRALFSGRRSNVVEVGAGTGAALWAWTLLTCYAIQARTPLPVVSWTSLDSSADMLAQNERLWKFFSGRFLQTRKVVNRQTVQCANWRSPPSLPNKPAIVGSYVFSRLESSNATRTAKAFAAFVNSCGACAVVVWTKSNKSGVLNGLRNELQNWTDLTPQSLFACPLGGRMHKCLSVVSSTATALNVNPDPEWPKRFNWGKAPSDVSVLAMIR